MLASLEKQLEMLNIQLTQEINSHTQLKHDLEALKLKNQELETIKHSNESELSELKKSHQTFQIERTRVYEFLDKLVRIYDLSISSSAITQTSIEKNLELILGRVSKEVHSIVEVLNQKKGIEFDKEKYDKKIKLLKEELSNKEIHLNLLRKKLTEHEEVKPSELRIELDTQILEVKKTNMKFERLVEEVNRLRSDNLFLKSQILDQTKLIEEKNEKIVEIKRLSERLAHLEQENKQIALKFYDLRNEFELTSQYLDKSKLSSDHVIKSLSLEIKALKIELEKSKSREQQVNIDK
jgi:hypothetical protein